MRKLSVKKVTIRDVARHAGVSVATVSHVIDKSHYVSPELNDRVFAAIEALNYQPNKLARALSQKAVQPPRLVGKVIAETLLERLSGRTESMRRSVAGTLVFRASTAPPRSTEA